jgi:hypothetical protein
MKVKIKEFNGALSFTCSDFNSYNGRPHNYSDYVICGDQHQLNRYHTRFSQVLAELEDVNYRDLLCNAETKLDLSGILRHSPYGLTGPLAYPGGLLIYSISVMQIATAAAEAWDDVDNNLNRSLIVAGSIFRNIGWYSTTIFNGHYLEPKKAFYMTGIHRASFRLLHDTFLTLETDCKIKIPESKKQALENLCNPLAQIQTIEGQIVCHACNIVDTIYQTGAFNAK